MSPKKIEVPTPQEIIAQEGCRRLKGGVCLGFGGPGNCQKCPKQQEGIMRRKEQEDKARENRLKKLTS